MSNVVRRVGGDTQAIQSGEVSALIPHTGEGVTVYSQVAVGARPEVRLSWVIDASHQARGQLLMVFHSVSGFCSDDDPDYLTAHGSLIIETPSEGERVLYLDEGQHFFTFLLRRRGVFGGIFESRSRPVRFSETVPSMKVAISRIKDKTELDDLKHKHDLAPIQRQTELNEAQLRRLRSEKALKDFQNTKPPTPSGQNAHSTEADQEIRAFNELMRALAKKHERLNSLASDPDFQKLPEGEKRRLRKALRERLDPTEIGARIARDRRS